MSTEPTDPDGKRAALWTVSAVLVAGVVMMVAATNRATGDGFTFPLDDAYIHLGLARRFLATGTWGMNPGEFASASSSPAWTALEAVAMTIVGVRQEIGLLMSLAAAVAGWWVAVHLWAKTALEAWVMGLLLTALVPLPYLGVLGMEHGLHLAVVLALAGLAAREDEAEKALPWVIALAALAPLVRFESWFAVFWLAAWRAWRGDRRRALALICPALASTAAFMIFSVAQGGYPIPNSILMKSALSQSFVGQLRANLAEGTAVWVLVAIAALLPNERDRESRWVFAFAALTHLCLARVGWAFRYEAWLVGWGIVVGVPAFLEWSRDRQLAERVLVVALACLPLGVRAATATWMAPGHSQTTHDGDVLASRLIAAHWPEGPVAVHNIGAVSFYTDAHIVDIAGLASDEVTGLHLAHQLEAPAVDAILEREEVVLAITHVAWMSNGRPTSMVEAARWRYGVPNGGDTENVVWGVGDEVGHVRAILSESPLLPRE